jgi:hypothetical protein
MKVKLLFRAVKEQTFSKGNGIEMTEGQDQCDNKMTILSENRCVCVLIWSLGGKGRLSNVRTIKFPNSPPPLDT